MTIHETCQTIRRLGLNATHGDGEYRVTYLIAYLATKATGSRIELIALAERLAYYTNDADDAIATAKHMKESY